jgi:hypothetical protein
MTREEGIAAIRRLKTPADLYAFWQRLRVGGLEPEWEEGKAFEYLILRAFELEGARVEWPFSVRHEGLELEQIDGAVFLDGLYCLVEAKDRNEPANFEPIAKLRAQLQRRPSFVIGMVFSRRGFTPPAKSLTRMATPQNVLLWEGAELEHLLERNLQAWRRRRRMASGKARRALAVPDTLRQGLRRKVSYLVQEAIPDFSLLVD